MNSSSLSNMARVGKHERESKCNSIEVLKTENEVFLLMDKAANKHIQSLDSSEVTNSNVGANLFPIAEEGKFIGVFKPAERLTFQDHQMVCLTGLMASAWLNSTVHLVTIIHMSITAPVK